jgi:hypothetical protein
VTKAPRRFPLGFVVLAVAVLLLTSLTLIFPVNPSLISRYNEVTDGMTRNQVEELLGPPDEVKLLGTDNEQLTWRQNPEEAVVSFHRPAGGPAFIANFKSFRFIDSPGIRWRIRRWFERV